MFKSPWCFGSDVNMGVTVAALLDARRHGVSARGWLVRCQYTLTRGDTKFDLQLLSQRGST